MATRMGSRRRIRSSDSMLRSSMKLSEKFEEALIYATRAHGDQTRKKTGIPFVAHILGVTAIALEYGANETKRSARCFMIRWKIAVARSDCAISGKNLGMTSPGSWMDAPTHTRRQSRRGWNENDLTSSISKTPILQRGWYQRRINCITRVQSWLSFDDMVSKCSSASVEKRTERFGITEAL